MKYELTIIIINIANKNGKSYNTPNIKNGFFWIYLFLLILMERIVH